MGLGYACLHVAATVLAAGQRGLEALRGHRRRHAHRDHGEESLAALQRSAAVPGRARSFSAGGEISHANRKTLKPAEASPLPHAPQAPVRSQNFAEMPIVQDTSGVWWLA